MSASRISGRANHTIFERVRQIGEKFEKFKRRIGIAQVGI
jgi:hypothetical protein